MTGLGGRNYFFESYKPMFFREISTLNKLLLTILLCVLSVSAASWSNEALNRIKADVALLPEVSCEGDYKIFALQKNDYMRKYFSSETNLSFDLGFIGVSRRFYLMFRGEVTAGFGESEMHMLLHPFTSSYATIPTFEYRFEQVHVAAGLDHRCYHYIDVAPPDPIVYWNKFIITAYSPNHRMHPYLSTLLSEVGWRWPNRLNWSFSWGYYINKFFDLIDPIKLMSISRPHYLHDFQLTAQYGVVHWKWGALAVTDATMIGIKHSGEGVYWSQKTGADLLLNRRLFDASLFVDYILDDGCFNSKDRLLEFGIRIFK